MVNIYFPGLSITITFTVSSITITDYVCVTDIGRLELLLRSNTGNDPVRIHIDFDRCLFYVHV